MNPSFSLQSGTQPIQTRWLKLREHVKVQQKVDHKESIIDDDENSSFAACHQKSSIRNWLNRVYSSPKNAPTATAEGHLTLHLSDRVFGPAGLQPVVLSLQSLPKDVLADTLILYLTCMKEIQQSEMHNLLNKGLETCCAAANDFAGMSSECHKLTVYFATKISKNQNSHYLSTASSSKDEIVRIQDALKDLQQQYTKDAMNAVHQMNAHVFRVVEEQLEDELLSNEWKDEKSGCQVSSRIVSIVKDFLDVLQIYIVDDTKLVSNLAELMIRSSINFYIRHLLMKAEGKDKTGNKIPVRPVMTDNDDKEAEAADLHIRLVTTDNDDSQGESMNNMDTQEHANHCIVKQASGAVSCIHVDVATLRQFSNDMIEEHPGLSETVDNDFIVLECILGLLRMVKIGGDISLAMQLHLPGIMGALNNNAQACRCLIRSLYHLVAPDMEEEACRVFAEQHAEEWFFATSTHPKTLRRHDEPIPKSEDLLVEKEHYHAEILELEATILKRIDVTQQRSSSLLEILNQSMGFLSGSGGSWS